MNHRQAQPAAPSFDPARVRSPRATPRDAGLAAIEIELEAVKALAAELGGPLGAPFDAAVEMICGSSGRVFVSGMGKSGHVGRKIASTLASTGTLAAFIHPAEASHGDLGMLTSSDVVIALSWSGETAELSDLIAFSRRHAVKLIAITSNPDSVLARVADIVLALPVVKEACPHNLAPTSSSLIQLALGDALAMALLAEKGFSAGDFRVVHPGGKLSARLKLVGQLMHVGDEVPLVRSGMLMSDVLIAIVGKRFGCAGVVDEAGTLIGIVTDGDLRRHMGRSILDEPVEHVMTPRPITFATDLLASSALEVMNRRQITASFVVEDAKPVGILHIHDLLRAGIA